MNDQTTKDLAVVRNDLEERLDSLKSKYRTNARRVSEVMSQGEEVLANAKTQITERPFLSCGALFVAGLVLGGPKLRLLSLLGSAAMGLGKGITSLSPSLLKNAVVGYEVVKYATPFIQEQFSSRNEVQLH